MNDNCSEKSCCWGLPKAAAWLFGVAGSLAVIGGLAVYSVKRDPTPALDAQREVVRYQARRDLEAATSAELNKFAVDGDKENKAQVSVGRAMEILLAEWKDDATAGRAKLLERLEASKKKASFE